MSSMEDKAGAPNRRCLLLFFFSSVLIFTPPSLYRNNRYIIMSKYHVLCLTLLPLVSPPSDSCAHTLLVFPPPLLQSSLQPATVFRISDCNAGKFSFRLLNPSDRITAATRKINGEYETRSTMNINIKPSTWNQKNWAMQQCLHKLRFQTWTHTTTKHHSRPIH